MYKFIENHRENLLLEIGQIIRVVSDSNFINSNYLESCVCIVEEDKGNGWYIVKRLHHTGYELISPMAEVILVNS